MARWYKNLFSSRLRSSNELENSPSTNPSHIRLTSDSGLENIDRHDVLFNRQEAGEDLIPRYDPLGMQEADS
jgi:hypothetical protein